MMKSLYFKEKKKFLFALISTGKFNSESVAKPAVATLIATDNAPLVERSSQSSKQSSMDFLLVFNEFFFQWYWKWYWNHFFFQFQF